MYFLTHLFINKFYSMGIGFLFTKHTVNLFILDVIYILLSEIWEGILEVPNK